MYLISKYNKINLEQKIAQSLKALGDPSRKPGFNSLHPNGSSKPFVTPVPEDSMISSGHLGHHTQKYTTDMSAVKKLKRNPSRYS